MVDFMNKTGNINKIIERILSAIREKRDINIPDFRLAMLLKSYEAMEVYHKHLWATGENCGILKQIAADYYKQSKISEKDIYERTRKLWKTQSETLF